MTTQMTQRQIFKQIEHIENINKASFLQKLISQIQQFSRKMIHRLTTSEPIIKHVRDKQGYIRWYVYDPTTDHSAYLASEQEVLMWLEKRISFRQSDSHWNNAALYQSRWLR